MITVVTVVLIVYCLFHGIGGNFRDILVWS